jgi:hypothetical protein
MAGNFTKQIYDNEAYNEQIARSTNPLLYKLDPNYTTNCNNCFAPYGPRGGHDNAVIVGDKIDVDSVLKGITRVNSKANRHHIPDPINNSQYYVPNECPGALETQYSRYSHPSFDIRGLNVKDMRFGYPLNDPQCQIFENFGVNTRLQAKDNHKAIWQTPVDQRNSLPTERLNKIKKCTVTLNCNYAPY